MAAARLDVFVRFLVTTKFQPTFARRAFPCLDEPQFKSNFTVTLVHRSNFTALSNMPPQVGILQSVYNSECCRLTQFYSFRWSCLRRTTATTSTKLLASPRLKVHLTIHTDISSEVLLCFRWIHLWVRESVVHGRLLSRQIQVCFRYPSSKETGSGHRSCVVNTTGIFPSL
jgi:Peptidase M1 N-terminal domain